MEKKEIVDSFNKFRAICLKNAEDLLKASKICVGAGIDNVSFHLSLLALEEIGKVEMEIIKAMSLLLPKSEPINYNFAIDDHKRKLFFAFWGPSFGREKQTKKLLDTDHSIAKNLHGRRLLYLYSDPQNPQHWSELMKEGEAKSLFDLTETRLKIEQAKDGLSEEHAAEPDKNLLWFLKIQEDEQHRKEIWGQKSQEKLLELGDVKNWIAWMREIYEKHDQEMRDLVKREIKRTQPVKEQRMDPKWRVSIEIITPSHSIRQKNLNTFNKGTDWIQLKYKDAHTLGIDFILSKNIPIHGLWEYGWGMARMFLMALNIATNGFFWWNIKRDPSRYYEKIWDLENDTGVEIQLNPRLEINWRKRRFVLNQNDLTLASLIFSYILFCNKKNTEKHLNNYTAGLSLLAKNDIHLRLELNAFEEFFKSLKIAMIENGDWDQKILFEGAYQKATAWRFEQITEEMKKIFSLGFRIEAEKKGNVDLTAVFAIKNYAEVYFKTLMVRFIKKEKDQDIRIVMEKEKKPDEKE